MQLGEAVGIDYVLYEIQIFMKEILSVWDVSPREVEETSGSERFGFWWTLLHQLYGTAFIINLSNNFTLLERNTSVRTLYVLPCVLMLRMFSWHKYNFNTQTMKSVQ